MRITAVKIFHNTLRSICGNFLELFSRIWSLDKKSLVFIPSTREPFSGNTWALFEFIVEKRPDYKVVYFINDRQLMKALNLKYGCEMFYFSGSFSAMLLAARSGAWITYDLPLHFYLLSIFKNPKRMVYYLGHGIPLKRIALASRNVSFLRILNRYLLVSCYSHILGFSTSIIPVMKEAFGHSGKEFFPVGQPRLDSRHESNVILDLNKILCRSSNPRIVLYAPTWRYHKSTEFFPFENFCIEKLNSFLEMNNIFIFLRPHGKKPFDLPLSLLSSDHVKMFDSFTFPDVNAYLDQFNALVTDYSSIFFDFLVHDRPVGFIPYDYNEYEENPGFGIEYYKFTPGKKIHTFDDFLRFLGQIDDDGYSIDRARVVSDLNIKNNSNCEENLSVIDEWFRDKDCGI